MRNEVRTEVHAGLAESFATFAKVDAELVARHYFRAGNTIEATRYALIAANEAMQAFAYERACRLYDKSIRWVDSLGDSCPFSRREIHIRLAWALAHAGRCYEAARTFEQVALHDKEGGNRFRRIAADLLLRSGHVGDGIAMMTPILKEYQLPTPTTQFGVMASFITQRVWTKCRWPDLTSTGVGEFQDTWAKERADVCWGAAIGLLNVDQMRSGMYHAHHLNLALESNDRDAVARALMMEALMIANLGGDISAYQQVLTHVDSLLAGQTDRYLCALDKVARAAIALFEGRFSQAYAIGIKAQKALHEQRSVVAWERDTARLVTGWAMGFLGRFAELRAVVIDDVKSSELRGDLYAAMCSGSGLPNIVWLVDGDVATARRQADNAIGQWSQTGFHLQHLFDLYAQTNIELYEGNSQSAYERVAAAWPKLKRSGLLRPQMNRVLMLEMFARVAIAYQAVPGADVEFVRTQARASLVRLHKEHGWASALAEFFSIQLEACSKQTQPPEEFRNILEQLHHFDLEVHVAAARMLDDSIRGRTIRATGVLCNAQDPLRLASVFAPVLRACI